MNNSNDLEPIKTGLMNSVKNSRILLFIALTVASSIPFAAFGLMITEQEMSGLAFVPLLAAYVCLVILGWRNRWIRGKLGVAAILVGVLLFLMLDGIGVAPKDGTIMATIVRFSLVLEAIMILSGFYLLVSMVQPRS